MRSSLEFVMSFPLFVRGNAVRFCMLVFFRDRPSFLQSSRRRYFLETFSAKMFVCEFFLWDLSRHGPIFVGEMLCVFALQVFDVFRGRVRFFGGSSFLVSRQLPDSTVSWAFFRFLLSVRRLGCWSVGLSCPLAGTSSCYFQACFLAR